MKIIELKTKPKKAKAKRPYKATIKIKEAYNFIEEQGNAFLNMEDFIQPEELMRQLINVELDICLFRDKTITLPAFFHSVDKTVFKIMNAVRVNGERLVYYPYKFTGNFEELKKVVDEFASDNPHIPVMLTNHPEEGEVYLHTIESLEGEINDFLMEELGLTISDSHFV